MPSYKPGTVVPVTFAITVDAAPTAVRWRALDENETVLQDWTLIDPLPTGAELVVALEATLTSLPAGALRALRVVELELQTPLGTFVLSESVLLQGATQLAPGLNSFQSYYQALFLIEGQHADQISGWQHAERDQREKALVEAHLRLLQLPLALEFGASQTRLTDDAWLDARKSQRLLRDLAPADVLALHAPLLGALRLAQAAEANDILDPDSPRAAANAGLVSLTVGESSQTWRQGATGSSRAMEYPVCPRAIALLQRWLRYGAKIGRS